MSRVLYHIIILILLQCGGSMIHAQCITSVQHNILDVDTTWVNILVEGAINDDLSDDAQGLCGVSINFSHDVVGELEMTLISPSGQSILLLGAPIGGNNTSLANWNITMIPCSAPASPDAGFSSTWSNADPWGFIGFYSGTYYPNFGCLEDFNLGSVNGVWSFQIEDPFLFNTGQIESISLFFCDSSGLDCNDCTVTPFSFTDSSISECFGSDHLDFIPPVIASTSLLDGWEQSYIIIENDVILAYTDSLQLSQQSPGNYTICHINQLSSSLITLPPIGSSYSDFNDLIDTDACIALSENCLEVIINTPTEYIEIDSILCQGETIIINGELIFESGEYINNSNIACDTVELISVQYTDVDAFINTNIEDLDCTTSSVVLEGINSNFTNETIFTWYSNANNNVAISSSLTAEAYEEGWYFLELSDNNCTSIDSIYVDYNGLADDIEIVIQSQDCIQGTAVFEIISSAEIAVVEWFFNTMSISDALVLSVDQAGLYTAEINLTNGCQYIRTISFESLSESSNIVLDTLSSPCNFDTLIIVASSEDELEFTWQLPNGATIDSDTISLIEDGELKLFFENEIACIDSAMFDFELPKEIIFELDDLTISCNDEIVLYLNQNPTEEILSIEWYLDQSLIAVDQDSLIVSEEGMYIVEGISSDGCLAIDTSTVTADIDIPNYAIASVPNTCTDSAAYFINDVYDDADYLWELPDGSQRRDSIIYSSQVGIFTAIVTSAAGCIDSMELMSTFDTIVPSNGILSNMSMDCPDRVELFHSLAGDSNYEVLWSTESGVVFSSQDTVRLDSSGMYILTTSSNENGCVSYDTIVIELSQPLIGIEFTITQPSCDDADDGFIEIDTTLGGVAPFNYFIDEVEVQDINVEQFTPGEYDLQVIDSQGCILDTTMFFTPMFPIYVESQNDTLIDFTDSLLINPTVINESSSSFELNIYTDIDSCQSCSSLEINPEEDVMVVVEVINEFGCSDLDTFLVSVNVDDLIYIPNSFSPNGDHVNDTLIFGFSNSVSGVEKADIYDRWGNLVFSTDSNAIPWDGTFKGEDLPNGVYVYHIVFSLVNGEIKSSKGTVSIIR